MIPLRKKTLPIAATDSTSDSWSLNDTLWKSLNKPDSFDEYIRAWLAIQGAFIETARAGILRITNSDTGEEPVHCYWPSEHPAVPALFDGILNRAERERRGVVFSQPAKKSIEVNTTQSILISFPIFLGNTRLATAAFEIRPVGDKQLQRAMRQLQWGIIWLQKYFLFPSSPVATSDDHETQEQLRKVFDLLSTTLDTRQCSDAAALLTTELATLLRCDRVSIGILEQSRMKTLALSHSTEKQKKTNIINSITAALEEASDQKETVHFPPREKIPGIICRAHEALATNYGCGSLLTIPFLDSGGEAYGAILFERPGKEVFREKEVILCQAVSTLSGPVLRDKYDKDLPLIRRGRQKFKQFYENRYTTSTPGMKLSLFALLFSLLFLAIGKGDFTIPAEVTVSGEIQRAIIAPFTSFVSDANHSAGDHVKKGTTLATLDTSDLTLEQLKWASRKTEADLEYRRAVADNLTANAKIILQQKKQAEIQLSLLDLQRQRTKITTPFDGLLVKGDLSQSIGAPVERGQVLFELVPDDTFRVILEVDEKDISFITAGQGGTIVLNSLPQQRFNFAVEKITPVSTPLNGKNSFRVEGKLKDSSPRLRPGMQGYGKIFIARKNLLWIWSRTLLDHIRIWLWSAL